MLIVMMGHYLQLIHLLAKILLHSNFKQFNIFMTKVKMANITSPLLFPGELLLGKNSNLMLFLNKILKMRYLSRSLMEY